MSIIDASVLAILLETINLATSGNYNELDRRDLISKISRPYIKDAIKIVHHSRYIVPSNISEDDVTIVEFDDRRGYAIEIPIKVTRSGDDDLVEIIFGFELLNNRKLRLANAYW